MRTGLGLARSCKQGHISYLPLCTTGRLTRFVHLGFQHGNFNQVLLPKNGCRFVQFSVELKFGLSRRRAADSRNTMSAVRKMHVN